jgi:hypothetical protein
VTTMPVTDEEEKAGDFLVGADAIHAYLVILGMPTRTDVYYLRRTGWPIGNTAAKGGRHGGKLVASKRRLLNYIEKITRGAE